MGAALALGGGGGGGDSSTPQSITIKVNPALGWQSTDITLPSGQSFSISSTGIVYVGRGDGGPDGFTPDGDIVPATSGYVAPGLNRWSLVGRIGGENPFFVGSNYSGNASINGILQLSVNDFAFTDNSGSWSSVITY